MPVTIKDVAKKAGVSISTVSRVINDSKPVSSGIKDRVLKVIEETGYVPNPVARSLVMKKSNLIGVLVPSVGEYYVGDFLNGIEEIARMYSYDIILCNTYDAEKREIDYINLLRSKQVAGIITLSGLVRKKSVDLINKYEIPGVHFGLNTDDYGDSYTTNVDMKSMTKDLIKTIIKNEKKDKILYIRDIKDSKRSDYLEELFQHTAKQVGISSANKKVLKVEEDVDKIYNGLEEILKKNKISGILCESDRHAINTIYSLEDMGLNVPNDIKVATYFETKLTRYIRPGVTTIRRPLYDMGAICARLIVKQIDGDKIDKKRTILPYRVIERESTN